jgi:hypothetical protein
MFHEDMKMPRYYKLLRSCIILIVGIIGKDCETGDQALYVMAVKFLAVFQEMREKKMLPPDG